MVVTCAIRDNAERKVWQRLRELDKIKQRARANAGRYVQIGVLGCMAGTFVLMQLGGIQIGPAVRCSVPMAGNRALSLVPCCRSHPIPVAERLKTQLLESERLVDLVAGPDAYRDLPRMLSVADEGNSQVVDPADLHVYT